MPRINWLYARFCIIDFLLTHNGQVGSNGQHLFDDSMLNLCTVAYNQGYWYIFKLRHQRFGRITLIMHLEVVSKGRSG